MDFALDTASLKTPATIPSNISAGCPGQNEIFTGHLSPASKEVTTKGHWTNGGSLRILGSVTSVDVELFVRGAARTSATH